VIVIMCLTAFEFYIIDRPVTISPLVGVCDISNQSLFLSSQILNLNSFLPDILRFIVSFQKSFHTI
jgi:hypothetical protein